MFQRQCFGKKRRYDWVPWVQDVAVQCMGEAFGMSLEDEEVVKKHSIKPLTLPSVFSMGMQVLSAGEAKAGENEVMPSPSLPA